MAGYYTLFQSEKNSEWYFNLKAGNHETVLSSEGYTARSGAENGIASVQKNGTDETRFLRKENEKGNFWFLLTAVNGQNIGKGEMYSSAAARTKGIESVMANASSTVVKST